LISVANAKKLCKRAPVRYEPPYPSGGLEADKTLIMLRKFYHVSRYDGLLDASRVFCGFAVRDGNPRTHKSRLNCPLEK
jgi:hypothetical protein